MKSKNGQNKTCSTKLCPFINS